MNLTENGMQKKFTNILKQRLRDTMAEPDGREMGRSEFFSQKPRLRAKKNDAYHTLLELI